MTLNLREPAGQDLLPAAASRTPTSFVENFRPGTLEKWNLGYDRLREINPGLVLVRVSGYGQTGPYSSRAGYGSIGEAMGGLRYITGEPDRQPSRTGISIGDSLAAMHATIGALAALRHRDLTGEGQVVDSAIYEAVLAMMESHGDRVGRRRATSASAPAPCCPTSRRATSIRPADDQLILIAANQDSVFGRLAALMDEPELVAAGSRYADHSGRGEHQQELDDHIGVWTAKHDADELLALLHEGGVPAGRIYKAADMLTRPALHRTRGDRPGPGPQVRRRSRCRTSSPSCRPRPGSIRWTGPELGPAQRRGLRRPARTLRRRARAGSRDRRVI